jgi:D-aminopeptidase
VKKDLTILGSKVHPEKTIENDKKSDGSIIVIIATNAPLTSRQLYRLAKRTPFGIAKTGGFASHGSGDIAIAFSTANKINHDAKKSASQTTIMNDAHPHFTSLLRAVVETTEEAILNSLCMATTMKGRDDHIIEAIGPEKIKEHIDK